MQEAKLSIAFAAVARWAGVKAGGPPPGRNLRQACIAAWNCGESGLTFPPIVTPKTVRERLDAAAAEPTEAENPCESKQAANAAVLGRADFAAPTPEDDAASPFEGALVVPRFATGRSLRAATASRRQRPSSVRTEPNTGVSMSLQSRKAERSKTALKRL